MDDFAADILGALSGSLRELSLGVYLLVKGFKSSAITTDEPAAVVADQSPPPGIARPPKPAVAVR
jgi:hypothetical protein